MDHARLFAAVPTPFMVMDSELVIVGANDAYLESVGRTLPEILGRPVFDAFPPTEDAVDETGMSWVQRSFEKARDTGLPDVMPVQRYDITDAEGGALTVRYWSLTSVPVLDDGGRCTLIVQRAEDVTDFVLTQQRTEAAVAQGEQWRRRFDATEADLHARDRELRDSVAAERLAVGRLASLARAAMDLTAARTAEDVARVVLSSGIEGFGASAAELAVGGHPDGPLTLLTRRPGSDDLGSADLSREDSGPTAVAVRTGRPLLLATRGADPAVVPGDGTLGLVALPLTAGGRVLGSFMLEWPEREQFPATAIDLLAALAAQCAQTLDRIQAVDAEREAAAEVLRMSETLQRSLLTEPPPLPGFEVAVLYRPASLAAQVGGDWYDVFHPRPGATMLVVGDVAGHDRDAAASMGQLRNLLRGVALTADTTPAGVLSGVDRALARLGSDELATVVVAELSSNEGGALLRWSNAGHPPPLLIRAGTVGLLESESDLMVGVDPFTSRSTSEVPLEAGDTVVLYTDGLVERRDESIEDGLARLSGTALRHRELPVATFCKSIADDLAEHPDDDIAILAVRVQARPED